jgi:large subunit ribosomal protein L19
MNRQQMIESVERTLIKDDVVPPRPGDTVKVHVKVVEGDKTRIQVFQGVVINVRGEGGRKSFTVRKVSMGVAVERIFPLFSPSIAKLEVTRPGKVRRAKLFYLRGKKGKAGRIAEAEALEGEAEAELGTDVGTPEDQ